MPKVLVNSSGKNNKSCRRVQQNWVCIFMILLRFSTYFTSFSKSTLLFEIAFCEKDPGDSWFLTDTPSVSGSVLGKNWGLAMWSLGGGRRGRRNSGELRRRGRSGTGVGCSWGSLGSISTRGWGRGGTGEVVRRRRPLLAAVHSSPARWQLGGKCERVGGL
jgi:hypothetical protein